MGIISRMSGNPFDKLKMDQLTEEKIKTERRERLVIGDIRELSGRQKMLVNSGYGKDVFEQRILARQIDQADKQLKLKNIQLKRLSDEVKVVDNFIFVLENRKSLEDSGVMKIITKIPKTKLSDFLAQVNLKERLERDKISGVLHTMESEFGLVGEIEDDASTSALLEMWGSEQPATTAEAYDEWQNRRQSNESVAEG
jgi:hypothetical protein